MICPSLPAPSPRTRLMTEASSGNWSSKLKWTRRAGSLSKASAAARQANNSRAASACSRTRTRSIAGKSSGRNTVSDRPPSSSRRACFAAIWLVPISPVRPITTLPSSAWTSCSPVSLTFTPKEFPWFTTVSPGVSNRKPRACSPSSHATLPVSKNASPEERSSSCAGPSTNSRAPENKSICTVPSASRSQPAGSSAPSCRSGSPSDHATSTTCESTATAGTRNTPPFASRAGPGLVAPFGCRRTMKTTSAITASPP